MKRGKLQRLMHFRILALLLLFVSWAGVSADAQPVVQPEDLARGCTELKTLSSGTSGVAIELTFENKTKRNIVIHWVDFHGIQRPLSSLPPGGVYGVRTFVSHAFLVVDTSGECLGAFTVWRSQGLAIDEPQVTGDREVEGGPWQPLLRTVGAPLAMLALALCIVTGIRWLTLVDGHLRDRVEAGHGPGQDAKRRSQLARIRGWRSLALASAALCLVVGVPAANAWRDNYGTWRPDTPTTVPPIMVVLPPPPPQPQRPVNGIWDVTVVCPNGGKISERHSLWQAGRLSHEFVSSNGLTGRSELALGYAAEGMLVLRGYASFGTSTFERIEGTARLQDTYYTGTATMGTSAQACELVVRQPA